MTKLQKDLNHLQLVKRYEFRKTNAVFHQILFPGKLSNHIHGFEAFIAGNADLNQNKDSQNKQSTPEI